ncbi:MAG: c-type cytochrome [Acidimicrobiia bacterium]
MTLRKAMVFIAAFALILAACGGGSDSGSSDTTAPAAGGSGDPIAGATVYAGTCSACHGTDLKGIDGLGKQLAPSDFVAERTEDELVAFILVGRPAGDPDNTTGVDMAPKGGNPSLSDSDIHDVSAYLIAQQ